MGVYPIGGQRIGIVTDSPVLDGAGKPVVSEFMEALSTEGIVWADGCLIEVQPVVRVVTAELQGPTVTTSEVAVAFLPVVGDQVPLVDENGVPAGFKPVTEITSSVRLREFGTTRTYVMRGDAVLEKDIRGRADHIECLCEHEGG